MYTFPHCWRSHAFYYRFQFSFSLSFFASKITKWNPLFPYFCFVYRHLHSLNATYVPRMCNVIPLTIFDTFKQKSNALWHWITRSTLKAIFSGWIPSDISTFVEWMLSGSCRDYSSANASTAWAVWWNVMRRTLQAKWPQHYAHDNIFPHGQCWCGRLE